MMEIFNQPVKSLHSLMTAMTHSATCRFVGNRLWHRITYSKLATSGKWLKLQLRLSLSYSSLSQTSTIMGEAIRKIPAQTGMIDPGIVPFGRSVFKEPELVLQ